MGHCGRVTLCLSSHASCLRLGSQPPGVTSGGGPGLYQGAPSVTFTAKREAERAAVQDNHIHHLRHQIESRLKVSGCNPSPSLQSEKGCRVETIKHSMTVCSDS